MQEVDGSTGEIKVTQALSETTSPPELNVQDVLAEAKRLLGEAGEFNE